MGQSEDAQSRIGALEHALERERQTQFELRRQLLAADEALNRIAAQHAELEAWRTRLRVLYRAGRQLHFESGEPGEAQAFLQQVEALLFEETGDGTGAGQRRAPPPLDPPPASH